MRDEKEKSLRQDNLEKDKDSLLRRISELTNLFGHKKRDIKNLRTQLRNRDKEYLSTTKSIIEQITEAEKYLSFIYIEDNGRIVASTSTFRKTFDFNDPDKPIEGRYIFTALKAPDDALDYVRNIRERFKEPEKLKLQTTIYNGGGEEKIIVFTKYKPIVYKIGSEEHSYTKIDIYEIGWVKREFGQVMRTLHLRDGEPDTLEKFIVKKIIGKNIKEGEEEKKNILSGKYSGKKENVRIVSRVDWQIKKGKLGKKDE